VRIGGYDLTTDPPSAYQERYTSRTVVHPSFNPVLRGNLTLDFMTHDAAILVLQKPSSLPHALLPAFKGGRWARAAGSKCGCWRWRRAEQLRLAIALTACVTTGSLAGPPSL
jgi:hypothetical protein